ncbi:unnamed protein product, partial [Nesidiocoris tenuis]
MEVLCVIYAPLVSNKICRTFLPFRSTILYNLMDDVSACFLTPLTTLLSVLPIFYRSLNLKNIR